MVPEAKQATARPRLPSTSVDLRKVIIEVGERATENLERILNEYSNAQKIALQKLTLKLVRQAEIPNVSHTKMKQLMQVLANSLAPPLLH